VPDYLCKKPIKKNSSFYLYFKNLYDQVVAEEENCDQDNNFYSPSLVEFMLENYLPLFPLMSIFFVPNLEINDLPTTSSIENYWKNVKLVFKNIAVNKRYVHVYFPMMKSFFDSQTKEFLLMKKNSALYKKLTNKRKALDPTLFYPNFKKKMKNEVSDTNYNEEDGFTKRKKIEKKPGKFVRRKLDFKIIEKQIPK
jgi:hypothetical protein